MSASKDHSIRLWNLKTDTLVAIFGGIEGHRDEVLSADFHLNLKYIVSCGMDHALKIWRLDTDKMKQAIIDSYKYNSLKAREPFKTAKDTFPMFSTRNIHRNYVDSVSWMGNFILSKSCENSIVLWKPGKLELGDDVKLPTQSYLTDQSVTIIHKFESAENTIWFIRLTLNLRKKILAVGNSIGVIYLWPIDGEDPTNSK
jgi:polycomb protein EED